MTQEDIKGNEICLVPVSLRGGRIILMWSAIGISVIPHTKTNRQHTYIEINSKQRYLNYTSLVSSCVFRKTRILETPLEWGESVLCLRWRCRPCCVIQVSLPSYRAEVSARQVFFRIWCPSRHKAYIGGASLPVSPSHQTTTNRRYKLSITECTEITVCRSGNSDFSTHSSTWNMKLNY